MPAAQPEKLSLVQVVHAQPRPASSELTGLGPRPDRARRRGLVEVVLHGADDAQQLREHKFVYTTEIARPGAQTRAGPRGRPPLRARRCGASGAAQRPHQLPPLDDYSDEMKKLAREPRLVKPITLPFKTLDRDAPSGHRDHRRTSRRHDGKPVFLQMGAHHAREWPSGEHAMEWAYELVNGYKAGNARVARLMRQRARSWSRSSTPRASTPRARRASGDSDDGPRRAATRPPTCVIALRVPAQELPREQPRRRRPAAGRLRPARPARRRHLAVRRRPQPQLRRLLGRPGRRRRRAAPGGDFAQNYRGTGPSPSPRRATSATWSPSAR